MADKQALTARMPQDTYDRVERYRDKRDLTKSDAARRLVEAGLEAESNERKTEPQSDNLILLLWAIVAGLVGYGTLTHGLLGLVVLVSAALLGILLGKTIMVATQKYPRGGDNE